MKQSILFEIFKPLKSFYYYTWRSNIRFFCVYLLLNVFYSLLLTVFQAEFSNRFVIELIENFPFSFLSGPFVFFYCREEILQRPQFGLRDLFHFLPLVIYLFYGYANNIEIYANCINNIHCMLKNQPIPFLQYTQLLIGSLQI